MYNISYESQVLIPYSTPVLLITPSIFCYYFHNTLNLGKSFHADNECKINHADYVNNYIKMITYSVYVCSKAAPSNGLNMYQQNRPSRKWGLKMI